MAIALYMRVSTFDKQDHAAQEAALKAWEKGQTERVIWYRDSASGKDTNRPGFRAMMCDVGRGKITRIVVAALDRLGRNTHDFLKFIEDLKAMKAGFVSLREGLDPFTHCDSDVAHVGTTSQQKMLLTATHLQRTTIGPAETAGTQDLLGLGAVPRKRGKPTRIKAPRLHGFAPPCRVRSVTAEVPNPVPA